MPDSSHNRIVRFHRLGDASVLEIEQLPVTEPEEGELRIRVQAIGLNRAEIMFRTGTYLEQPEFPSRLGYEAAGIVEALGAGVTEFAIGDRVSTIPAFSQGKYGVYGETAIVPASAVAHYPENLSATEGTAIWMQYLTAYGGLVNVGHLQQGAVLLVTAASSSVGVAAIQMGKMLGAVVIATTRSAKKRDFLLRTGADHVITTEEEDLVASVMEQTSGRGFDLAFDPIGGTMLTTLGEAAAAGATIIEYGALATEPTTYPLFAALAKSLTIRGYVLFEITTNPRILAEAKEFIYTGLKSKKLTPVIDRVFPFDEIASAHKHMESNRQLGKIVVEL
jgi:NADPH:quinone reductase